MCTKSDFVLETVTGVYSFLMVSRRILIVLVSARRLSTFLASEGRFGARDLIFTLFVWCVFSLQSEGRSATHGSFSE